MVEQVGEIHDWELYAACLGTDPDLFFPKQGGSIVEAQAICETCVVRMECLGEAIRQKNKSGVWGGLPPSGRDDIVAERKARQRVIDAEKKRNG